MRAIRACLIAILALAACDRSGGRLPPELLGTWQTSAPLYAGRYLELQPGSVIFGSGPRTQEVHVLTGVEAEPGLGGATHYTIHYRAPDGEILALELDLTPGPPATLRLRNRDFEWHKQSTAREAS